ncbi:MAG: DUF547 domain-containing protein [Pseudomonadota bacterium]
MPLARFPQSALSALAISIAGLATPFAATAQAEPLFATYDAESTAAVDTDPYAEMIRALTANERGRTLVAYDIAHAQALPFFSGYANYLANVEVAQLNRDEQLAYWLNTRNFLLIQAISEERRVRGYKKKRGTPSEPGSFWTEKRITVSGTPLSLQDIEQDILFAGWDEPNIIFGLYQGVRGGPSLPQRPFTGANVHENLAEAAARFTADTRNLRVRGDKVRISSYFDWYLPLAYGGNETDLRTHLATLVKPQHQSIVQANAKLDRRNFSTEFEEYRTRQANVGSGSSGGGSVSRGGFGS